MRIYSNFCDENNIRTEREIELDPWPSELFARCLAKAAGISIWHARTALWANGAIGGHYA